eukprot:jgi/Psemu1/57604/gm1.57604_g
MLHRMMSLLPTRKLPTRKLRKQILIKVVYLATFWLNCSRTTSLPPTLTARDIMMGVVLLDIKDIGFQFLMCIQAYRGDTGNSMAPQTDNAVYLRPTGDLTGGFWACNIKMERRVCRQKGTSVLMSSAMIEKLEHMAEHDKMPSGLVFGDSQGHLTIHNFDEETNRDDDDASNDNCSQSNHTAETKLTRVINEGQAVTESTDTVINAPSLEQLEQQAENNALEADNNNPIRELFLYPMWGIAGYIYPIFKIPCLLSSCV